MSFARSHTLTSFDEAILGRSISRLNAARSQERLIGGKKHVATSLASSLASSSTSVATLASQHHQLQQQQIQQQMQQHIQQVQQNVIYPGQLCTGIVPQQDILVVEKMKRGGAMKTQATQTDVKRNGAQSTEPFIHQPLSPRTNNVRYRDYSSRRIF